MRLLVPALLYSVTSLAGAHSAQEPCRTSDEAKAIAECATLGEAVTVLGIVQTDGTKGWEVLVHMPKKEKGYRCIIDWDLAKVRYQETIQNPPSRRCSHCTQD